jgi:hypothetical protein
MLAGNTVYEILCTKYCVRNTVYETCTRNLTKPENGQSLMAGDGRTEKRKKPMDSIQCPYCNFQCSPNNRRNLIVMAVIIWTVNNTT